MSKTHIIDENFPISKSTDKNSSNSFTFAAMQHVLPQPSSQEIPRTMWKEIDNVVNLLEKQKKLSLMNATYQFQLSRGKGII